MDVENNDEEHAKQELLVNFARTGTLLGLIRWQRCETDDELFVITAAVFISNNEMRADALQCLLSFCRQATDATGLAKRARRFWKSIRSMEKRFLRICPSEPITIGVSRPGGACYQQSESDDSSNTSQAEPVMSSNEQLYGREGVLRAMSNNPRLAGNLLRYYASVDSPAEYRVWAKELAIEHILDSSPVGEHDFGMALYELFREKYVCASAAASGVWYLFDGVRWVESDVPTELLNAVSATSMTGLLSVVRGVLAKRLNDSSIDQDHILVLQKASIALQRTLKSERYIHNVLKAAARQFEDRGFQARLDVDPKLMAFRNGILDLNRNVAVVRPGRPMDFISRASTMALDFDLHEQSPIVVTTRDFLRKLFPDEHLYTFFLQSHCTIFEGINYDKVCKIWEGSSGSNGKSTLQAVFEAMLGSYSVKTTTALLTGKKPNAGQANPDLARAGGGVRDLVCDEPDSEEKLNPGTVKALTGNDVFAARDLFQKGSSMKEVRPTFHLRLIGNLIPECTKIDQAFLERLLPIPFKAEFLTPVLLQKRLALATAEEARYLFPVDTSMDARAFAPGLAWLLLDMRRRFLNGETAPTSASSSSSRKRPSIRDYLPIEVMEKKSDYASEHDVVGAFVMKNYSSFDASNTDILYFNDVRRTFEEATRNTTNKPQKNQLKKALELAFGASLQDFANGDKGWPRWKAV